MRFCQLQKTLFILATLAFANVGTPARAADITLVVDRQPNAIELYLTMSAHLISTTFNVPDRIIAEADGTVDFEPLRMGTFDIGDALFEGVSQELGGEPVFFEAMSLMVHPKKNALPLETPLDGMISIAVCTVTPPNEPIMLHDLQLYGGYIAYVDRPMDALAISFPMLGKEALTVETRDYSGGRLNKVEQRSLSAQAPSILIAPDMIDRIKGEWIAISLAFLINVSAVALAATLLSSRFRWTKGPVDTA